MSNDPQQTLREQIDDYSDTIYAILGFLNFYRHDYQKITGEQVRVFQGRRLDRDEGTTVTPDIGILLEKGNGLLGEVKHSFPSNRDFWMESFEQLKKYDQHLVGWPCDDELCQKHELVLLTHVFRSADVRKFFLEAVEGGQISFDRPLVIVEYHRSDQSKPFFFFRLSHGSLSEEIVNDKLSSGCPVPMEAFVKQYSKIKLYDGPTPIPLLMTIIWQEIVFRRASNDTERFLQLKKNQKLEVSLSLKEITEELQDNYSFKPLHIDYDQARQPEVPRKEYVRNACQTFVGSKEAKWANKDHDQVIFYFKKYEEDILEHCIKLYISTAPDEVTGQKVLFEDVG